ncbi:MAG: TonB family protein [Planctomycetales bacterium]|nr:TonB family protein [Planctomycetales bacterium]
MSLPTSLNTVAAGPTRAAASGARELVWTMLGNVALHASLIAVASIIPLNSAAWMLSAVPHTPPSGDNTIELSAAFLDAAAATPEEQAEAAPAMVMQTTPVNTEGSSEVAPREIDLSPLAVESAPQGASVDSDSLAEAAAENKIADLQTERRKNAQHQPQVADAPAKASSTPSRSTAAAPPAVGAPDVLPSEIHSPFPAYPPELLARRIQATVVLRVRIAADGTVAGATVHRSSGYAAMDQAALDGVKTWKFKPAMKDGKQVETIVRKPFTFEIRE